MNPSFIYRQYFGYRNLYVLRLFWYSNWILQGYIVCIYFVNPRSQNGYVHWCALSFCFLHSKTIVFFKTTKQCYQKLSDFNKKWGGVGCNVVNNWYKNMNGLNKTFTWSWHKSNIRQTCHLKWSVFSGFWVIKKFLTLLLFSL